MSEEIPRHGGDLTFARKRYGNPTGGWLDLSTGVNPHPYPEPAIDPVDLHRLPDREALHALLSIARRTYRVPDGVPLIATPGTEAAIRAIPRLASHRRVAIVGPTYGSHREAWIDAGRTIVDADTLSDVPDDATAAVVVNPNNPDGRTAELDDLADLARRLATRNGLIVVDEAFADLAPEVSLIPRLSGLDVIVLRSFGKFYGLPGLRLGFVTGRPEMIARLERLFGAWPVSGPAITLGRAALADRDWPIAMRATLAREARRLRRMLAGYKLQVVGGTDLFLLVEDAAAVHLHEALAERGIWTRAFAERPNWLRLGLPASEQDFARLDRALADCVAVTAGR